MVTIYCRKHHSVYGACSDCLELRKYALDRLERCPYGEKKPTCAKCPVHCYKPEMRRKIRAVMRYSGPRMICRHPVLAFRHLLDSRKKTTETKPEPE